MIIISSLLVTILFTGGVLLLLRKSPVDLVFGLALFSTATIVSLIAVGGWDGNNQAPLLKQISSLVSESKTESKNPATDLAVYTDPLPQALILTALVIGFAVLTFLIALVSRSPEDKKTGQNRGESG